MFESRSRDHVSICFQLHQRFRQFSELNQILFLASTVTSTRIMPATRTKRLFEPSLLPQSQPQSNLTRIKTTPSNVINDKPKSKVFRRSTVTKSNAKLSITYSFTQIPSAELLVATNDSTNKILSTLISNSSASKDDLLKELQLRFPKSTFIHNEDPNWWKGDVVSQTIPFFEHSNPTSKQVESILPHLELDSEIFTQLQIKTWKELSKIPLGSTLSYAELVSKLDLPSTYSRVIGRICGENPWAIIVPCHRVLNSKGELNGYRWGVEMKRDLLRREGVRI